MFGRKSISPPADGPRMSADVTQFMAKLGLSDDEIAEVAAPVSEAQRAIDESEAALRDFVSKSNEAWSREVGTTVNLWPYRMLPERCWNVDTLGTHHRTTLTEVLGLLPSQPWNLLLLAMDQATADALRVPLLPPMLAEAEHEGTETAIRFLREELELLDRLLMNPPTEGADAALASARRDATTRIMAMARPIAGAALGEDAVAASRRMFFGD